MKESQEKQVIDQLNSYGEVSRNWALKNFISRLSGIIFNLQHTGWVLKGEFRKHEYGKDYVYKVISKPVLKLFN